MNRRYPPNTLPTQDLGTQSPCYFSGGALNPLPSFPSLIPVRNSLAVCDIHPLLLVFLLLLPAERKEDREALSVAGFSGMNETPHILKIMYFGSPKTKERAVVL